MCRNCTPVQNVHASKASTTLTAARAAHPALSSLIHKQPPIFASHLLPPYSNILSFHTISVPRDTSLSTPPPCLAPPASFPLLATGRRRRRVALLRPRRKQSFPSPLLLPLLPRPGRQCKRRSSSLRSHHREERNQPRKPQ